MATRTESLATRPQVQKREKAVRKERDGCTKQKFREEVETLRKRGKEDESSEEEQGEESEEPKFPEVFGNSLNLSKMNLKTFPEELLDKMQEIQYLYLERNKLTELPVDFFRRLVSLKWLDLRNNGLTALPTFGLENHPNLEVILLQGNRIRNLPLELATVPSLKGLQTTGNPITNVPYEAMAEGFQGIKRHLHRLYTQEEIVLPVSDTIVVKPSTSRDNPRREEPPDSNEPTDSELRSWDLDKLSQWRQFMKKKSRKVSVPECKDHGGKTAPEKTSVRQPKISVSVRSPFKATSRLPPFRCGASNKNKHKITSSALHHMKMKKTRLGYRRNPVTVAVLQEKARREAYMAQVRETLEKQARKIQRMRDKEVLKSWRDHARLTRQQMQLLDNYQQYPTKDFATKTPFDVDPEFLNMLNRVDLYRSLRDYDNRSKRSRKPKPRISALDLERQMNEIIKKLQELDTNDEEVAKPQNKQVHMCNKMHKIRDIQKTLKNLQVLNSSMNGLMPIIKPKEKN